MTQKINRNSNLNAHIVFKEHKDAHLLTCGLWLFSRYNITGE